MKSLFGYEAIMGLGYLSGAALLAGDAVLLIVLLNAVPGLIYLLHAVEQQLDRSHNPLQLRIVLRTTQVLQLGYLGIMALFLIKWLMGGSYA